MKKERKSRKKITRQFLALVMVIILVCTTVDVPLMAADAQGNIQTEMGMDFIITGTDLVYGVDYTYPANTGILTILSDKKITIENAKKDIATTDSIEVADGVNANITLAGVNIDVSTISDKVAFKIADDSTGNVTITLADGETNTLKSGLCCAGLQKKGPYISDTQGKLIIQGGVSGTGTLNAIAGSQAAGIGGREGSNIEIKGGKITALIDLVCDF